ncbi:glycerophosphoryl diester phosphodiesterase [Paenibacillus endophyticus]|uniref:Glycerophosphoryl diester phosphodiesterase n=1 Tax=Paenibacillus endophyticus TaxID=1294268 RepID=A0A7W5CFB4_9BACL|nr:glycerophosphodiester phosphodiesterase family protein [Paenibacillus endophyticus]MBB3156210.1 glycerophosphoryl diester phosphodiesterase [Paenibacillus endophyticus]
MMSGRDKAYVWRRIGIVLVLLGCATLIVSASNPNTPEGFLIIAHRGASGHEPENTMAAFEEAERLGSDFIEFDVQLSKDKELVVIHDDTVDRTTDHQGAVDDYTLDELENMDAPAGKSSSHAEKEETGTDKDEDGTGKDKEKDKEPEKDKEEEKEKIVSLEEVLDRFAGKMAMLIEIKDSKLYPGIEEQVAQVIRSYEKRLAAAGLGGHKSIVDLAERKNSMGIVIQSYDFESTRLMHNLLPNVPIAALVHEDKHPLPDATLDALTSFSAYIHYPKELLDKQTVERIHERGRKVIAWTIQNDEDMVKMKKLGVDGVITDYPG